MFWTGSLEFEEKSDASRGMSMPVVTFIALHESSKGCLLEIRQTELFVGIYVGVCILV